VLAVVAHYRTAPDACDLVAAVLARHPAASRAEPGHLPFEASRSIHDPGRFVLDEACTSEDASQAHRNSPHSAQNAGRVREGYDFVAWASASAEKLWRETEDRLPDALAAMDAGTLLGARYELYEFSQDKQDEKRFTASRLHTATSRISHNAP
jgi:quinol monooxygenase YgiN